MVGLRDGTWAEVRALALGTVTLADDRGTAEPLTSDLSYFARLVTAETFGRLATVEAHWRGTLAATTVVGVVDGAVWCQSFLDLQRPDAVRILDFAHAVSYLAAAAEARSPSEPLRAQTWLADQRRDLRAGQAEQALAHLAAWLADDAAAQAGPIGTAHGYLGSRLEHIRYADLRPQPQRWERPRLRRHDRNWWSMGSQPKTSPGANTIFVRGLPPDRPKLSVTP